MKKTKSNLTIAIVIVFFVLSVYLTYITFSYIALNKEKFEIKINLEECFNYSKDLERYSVDKQNEIKSLKEIIGQKDTLIWAQNYTIRLLEANKQQTSIKIEQLWSGCKTWKDCDAIKGEIRTPEDKWLWTCNTNDAAKIGTCRKFYFITD